MLRWALLALFVATVVEGGHGAPVIAEIVSRALNPAQLQLSDLDLKQGNELSEASSKNSILQTRSADPGPALPRVRPPPPLPPLPPPRLSLLRAITPRDVNRGLTKALSAVTILGQIDSYISERARAIVRKLLMLVDDPNRLQPSDY